MAQTGLLGWANSVRMTMASDPGRKLFQEQVQTHGFSFLDDYLDNILYGAKQDPLIELVKTPGRKKAIARKPKLASKLAQVVTMSLEADDEESVKENAPPVNSFTQALLNAKDHAISKPLPPPLMSPSEEPMNPAYSDTGSEDVHMRDCPTGTQITELSVINEDEEGVESGRVSLQSAADPPLGNANMQRQPTAMQVDIAPQPTSHSGEPSVPQPPADDDTHSISASSADTFHSIPPESPGAGTSDTPKQPAEFLTTDISVPIRDPEMQSLSPKLPVHKNILSTLPTLPEPIPLRKSMRIIKDPSVSSVMQGTATPGAAGKRTSWLMKAREVKAMEGGHKKSTVNNPPAVTPGVKRKSEETTELGDEGRASKVLKVQKDEAVQDPSPESLESQANTPTETSAPSTQDEMLDRLKKKLQGLEARNDKPNNKASGDAAVALAEARAQAEARVAERNYKEEGHAGVSSGTTETKSSAPQTSNTPPTENQRRFSISDLFPAEGKIKDKSRAPEKGTELKNQPVEPVASNILAHTNSESTSTTPPHSPPARGFAVQSAPVFNKPPPVFVPPVVSARPLPTPPAIKESGFSLPPLPASMALGISPQFGPPHSNHKLAPVSAQSTLESVVPSDFFGERGHTEAWVPGTQDTEYSSAFASQQQVMSNQPISPDDDDSWPIEEKLSQGVHWPFGRVSKEDSMTWSTLPSQSQRADTGPASKDPSNHEVGRIQEGTKQSAPPGFEESMDIEQDDYNTGVYPVTQDDDLEELILSGAKSTHGAPSEMDENGGQSSLASSVSSQSQAGFFGQASKYLSSTFGSNKKNKPEMKKVIQMAAVAAKKQQQEDDKKAARLKEMESRRQAALQRKAEEEKTRHQEQERKVKEEIERRKREREEQVEKKPIKPMAASTSHKKEEEVAKKRKMEHENSEKKLESKKQTPLNKTGFKPSSSKPATALSSSTAYNASQSQPTTLVAPKPSDKPSKVPTAIPTKGKNKPSAKTPAQPDDEHTQPSQIVQTQMAARAKAAMQTEPAVSSESIELPEVNSEYSDSEDEDRPRSFNPPGWAQSPDLREALHAQSTINPDDIFGAVQPLRMEDIFKARTSRFRARTSSANWSGTDRLTVEEEREYARRMGFK